ncbi:MULTISPECIES: hypothetical protein [Paracoccus]|uniref:hypothetical protein n=1 Tax=Paracoccus TaxID=265 RepID=UPI00086F5696|nr:MULTISPECIES: hypothetical protein [Paracoccus]ODT57682.1 MAG: hypothetical protein ABS73_15955 [Paracoccus sp. SCN 68-21]
MPSKSTVSGVLQDAQLNLISGGKVVATLTGSDIFDGNVRIVTERVETTTGADGRWSMPLIVNGEGKSATSSWSVEIFNEFAVSVHKIENLFIATANPITLGALEKISEANRIAAMEATRSRLIMVTTFAEYIALPANQKRDTDVVLVSGV